MPIKKLALEEYFPMPPLAYDLLFLVSAALTFVVLSRRRQIKLKTKCEMAFVSIYIKLSPSPKFEMSYSYSYPAFTITFRSKNDLVAAEEQGFNASFTQTIGQLCKGLGSREHPFEAKRAIFFTFEGWLEEELARRNIVLNKAGRK